MMRTARLHGVGDIRLDEEPVPCPGPGQSLVRVTSVGICGSDLHWYGEGGIGDAVLKEPLVVGHEIAGVLPDGTPVAVDPAIPCEQCDTCRTGWGNLCPNVRFAGHGSLDGGLQDFMVWPTRHLHPLPVSLSADEGALLEPLGVALHSFDLGHVSLGDRVAVVGCGPIGLMLVQLALAAGAASVQAVEPLPHRLEAAVSLGAAPDGPPADIVFEVAGNDAAVRTSMTLARPGGRVVLAGIPDDDRTSFPASLARRKGLTLALVRRMHNTYPRAIELVVSGRIDVASLVTAGYPLTEVATAFTVATARTGLKIVVNLS
jgi:L-iditol 2-dehydrogenase